MLDDFVSQTHPGIHAGGAGVEVACLDGAVPPRSRLQIAVEVELAALPGVDTLSRKAGLSLGNFGQISAY